MLPSQTYADWNTPTGKMSLPGFVTTRELLVIGIHNAVIDPDDGTPHITKAFSDDGKQDNSSFLSKLGAIIACLGLSERIRRIRKSRSMRCRKRMKSVTISRVVLLMSLPRNLDR